MIIWTYKGKFDKSGSGFGFSGKKYLFLGRINSLPDKSRKDGIKNPKFIVHIFMKKAEIKIHIYEEKALFMKKSTALGRTYLKLKILISQFLKFLNL